MMMKPADLHKWKSTHPEAEKGDRLGAFFSTICWLFSSQGETIEPDRVLQCSHIFRSTSYLNLFFSGPKIFILSQILCLEEKVSKNLTVKIRPNWTQVLSFGAVFFTSEFFFTIQFDSFSIT